MTAHVTQVKPVKLADGSTVYRWSCSCGAHANTAMRVEGHAEGNAEAHVALARRRERTTAIACSIIHIEQDGPRVRYVCACGKLGPWESDFGTWRHVTKERAIEWNFRVHAALVANWATRRRPTHVIAFSASDGLHSWRCSCGKGSRKPLPRWRADRNADAHARAVGRAACRILAVTTPPAAPGPHIEEHW